MNTHMNTRVKPTLRGERVVLRPIGKRDAAAMYAATLDRESMRLTGTTASFTLERIERWCEEVADAGGRVDLAIVTPDGGDFLGEVVLNEIDEHSRCANFRIALAGERHFDRGYGSEAARLMLHYGFERLGLHRIELEVYSFNARALHLYEKLGFVREGVRREVLLSGGEYHDAVVMGLLAREFAG